MMQGYGGCFKPPYRLKPYQFLRKIPRESNLRYSPSLFIASYRLVLGLFQENQQACMDSAIKVSIVGLTG